MGHSKYRQTDPWSLSNEESVGEAHRSCLSENKWHFNVVLTLSTVVCSIPYTVVPQGRGHSSAILEAACAPTSSLRRGLEGGGFQIMLSHACPKAWSEGLPGFWDAGRWKLEYFLESCRVELSHGGNRRALLVWFYLWIFSPQFSLQFI